MTTYTKEEMFNWLEYSGAEVLRHQRMKWITGEGLEFHSNFTLRSGSTQWPAFATLSEAIQFAMNSEAAQ